MSGKTEQVDLNDRLTRIGVPVGDYCHEVVASYTNEQGIPRSRVRYCPFWYGRRPDGGCLLYGWDPGIGDACKGCGFRQPDALEGDWEAATHPMAREGVVRHVERKRLVTPPAPRYDDVFFDGVEQLKKAP